jgi:hypothetical protein
MKTIKFLLAIAVSMAGLSTSLAQTIYSTNAVAGIDLTLMPGLNLIQNPLDAGPAGNTVAQVLEGVPDGTCVYQYGANGFIVNDYTTLFGWSDPNMSLVPGEGVWVHIPLAGTNVTIVFVGNVMQGSLTNAIRQGFSMIGSQVPQEGNLDSLAYPKANGDVVFLWNASTAQFSSFSVNKVTGTWPPTAPAVSFAQAFFVNKVAATTWTREFHVGQ